MIKEENKMKKCIVTVLGKDTVGIVAKVCTYLAENKISILDISQTIIQGYFSPAGIWRSSLASPRTTAIWGWGIWRTSGTRAISG